ncbi:c-type cytochrome [Mucilaginibacter segetis]|uniref:C-type cytochrome n=1 Tax=Mucilaginibacter segetis TaxID=2793071 RepID=A0A934UNC3_9SPHI|nr:c-type cytochrome [Mucilaginibacter segetis]MBK0379762.1 c-type cytochrome [Mucilaginibacter segetis]
MKLNDQHELIKAIVKLSVYTVYIAVIMIVCFIILIISLSDLNSPATTGTSIQAIVASTSAPVTVASAINPPAETIWQAPDTSTIPAGKQGNMIRYGRELLAHTAKYFGPKGSIAQITNGMNCQNCHLDGGVRLFANNYAVFVVNYPKMSKRSGKVEPASERIAECFQRSLNGSVPDITSKEIKAMLAYMTWVGKDVKKGEKLFGHATEVLPYLSKPADPVKGRAVYVANCKSCHGNKGQGLPDADRKGYIYPPLWGEHSYNDGAGMGRIINFAGFVKNNMPYGSSTYRHPTLTNEEAWNVAAFVNSQPRPHIDQHNDWKKIADKPVDYPLGPYIDNFSEKQHKYGPFKPIIAAQKQTIK